MIDEINILGMKYKIEYTNVIDKFEPLYGRIDYTRHIISIDNTNPEERQKLALFHEILHGICEILGLTKINDDESTIQALSAGLYSALGDKVTF